MEREIIKIDEDLCNGCGDCIIGCSEGALQIIDGKARLVKEDFCDGFGDCIGACPTGALVIEKRESKPFDENATRDHLLATGGEAAVKKFEEAQMKHSDNNNTEKNIEGHHHGHGGGCPGTAMRNFENKKLDSVSNNSTVGMSAIPSELAQWPIQLHLVSPQAPFFKDKEMVVLSTCSPIASADIHWRYVRGRSVVVACPKLDDTSPYVDKLAEIFNESTIPKVIVVIMQVPCCKGLSEIVREAKAKCDRDDLIVEEHVMELQGKLLQVNNL